MVNFEFGRFQNKSKMDFINLELIKFTKLSIFIYTSHMAVARNMQQKLKIWISFTNLKHPRQAYL
jgi:hypothetical protein